MSTPAPSQYAPSPAPSFQAHGMPSPAIVPPVTSHASSKGSPTNMVASPAPIAIQPPASAGRATFATTPRPDMSSSSNDAPLPKPGDRQHRVLFDGFLYDYLYKSGYTRAAAALLADAPETPVQPRSPHATASHAPLSPMRQRTDSAARSVPDLSPGGSTSPAVTDSNISPRLDGRSQKEGSASSPDTPIEEPAKTESTTGGAAASTLATSVDSSPAPVLASLPKPRVPFEAPQAWLYEWHTCFWDIFRAPLSGIGQSAAGQIYRETIGSNMLKRHAPLPQYQQGTVGSRDNLVYPPGIVPQQQPSQATMPVPGMIPRPTNPAYSSSVYAATQAQLQRQASGTNGAPTVGRSASGQQMPVHQMPSHGAAQATMQAQMAQQQQQRAASIASSGDPAAAVADAQQAHNEALAARRQQEMVRQQLAAQQQHAAMYGQDAQALQRQRNAAEAARRQNAQAAAASIARQQVQDQFSYANANNVVGPSASGSQYPQFHQMQQMQQLAFAQHQGTLQAQRVAAAAGSPLNPHARLPSGSVPPQQPIVVSDPTRFRPSPQQQQQALALQQAQQAARMQQEALQRQQATMSGVPVPSTSAGGVYEGMLPPTSAHAAAIAAASAVRGRASPGPNNVGSPHNAATPTNGSYDAPTPSSSAARGKAAANRRKRDEPGNWIAVEPVDDAQAHLPPQKRHASNAAVDASRRSSGHTPTPMPQNATMPMSYQSPLSNAPRMVPQPVKSATAPPATSDRSMDDLFASMHNTSLPSAALSDSLGLDALLGGFGSTSSGAPPMTAGLGAEDDMFAKFINDEPDFSGLIGTS